MLEITEEGKKYMKPGRKGKMAELENEKYKNHLGQKRENSILNISTICVIPFQRLLALMHNTFERIWVVFTREGIKINGWEFSKNPNKSSIETCSMLFFIGDFITEPENKPIIKWDRFELYNYNCKEDKIEVCISCTDLTNVIKSITKNDIVHIFIYASENENKENHICFHIEDEKRYIEYKIQDTRG
jgi:hypothetical protein